MGKKIAWLVAGLVLTAVLVAAMVFLMKTDAPKTDVSSAEESKSVYLIEKDVNSLHDITVKNANGSFKIERIGKTGFGIESLKAFPKYDANYDEITQFASNLAASREVEKNPESLKKYGLQNPQATAAITYTDGDEITVSVGDEAPGGDGYYVSTSKSDSVYILSEAKTIRFLDDKLNYVSPEITSTDDLETEKATNAQGEEEEHTITPDIKSFTVERKDLDKPIRFIPSKERSKDDQLAALECIYQLDSPFNATLSSEGGSAPVDEFYGITANRVEAVNPTAADRKKYGFDDPTMRLTMKTVKAKYSHTILVGKGIYCDEKEPAEGHEHEIASYYCIIDDGKIVYEVGKDTLTWLTLRVEDVMSEYVVNPVMNEVGTIKISADGKNYRFDITGKKVGSEDGGEAKDTTKVVCNGKQINVTKFRNFYMFLNAITADSLVEGKAPTGKPIMKIEYIYRSKSRENDVVELVPYKNSTVAVVLNGDASIVTRAAFVDRAVENIYKITNNKEINPTW